MSETTQETPVLDPERQLDITGNYDDQYTVRFNIPLLAKLDQTHLKAGVRYSFRGFYRKDRIMIFENAQTHDDFSVSYDKLLACPSTSMEVYGRSYGVPESLLADGVAEPEQTPGSYTLYGRVGDRHYKLMRYTPSEEFVDCYSLIPFFIREVAEAFFASPEIHGQRARRALIQNMRQAVERNRRTTEETVSNLSRQLQDAVRTLTVANDPEKYLDTVLERVQHILKTDRQVHAIWFDANANPHAIIGPIEVKTITGLNHFHGADTWKPPIKLGYFRLDVRMRHISPLSFSRSEFSDYHPNVASSVCVGSTESLYAQLVGQGQYDGAIRLILTALERIDGRNPFFHHLRFPKRLTDWEPTESSIRQIIGNVAMVYLKPADALPKVEAAPSGARRTKAHDYKELFQKYGAVLTDAERTVLLDRLGINGPPNPLSVIAVGMDKAVSTIRRYEIMGKAKLVEAERKAA